MKVAFYLSAIVAGFALAVWGQPELVEPRVDGTTHSSAGAVRDKVKHGESNTRSPVRLPQARSPASPDDDATAAAEPRRPATIMAATGLVLKRQVGADGRFVGYRVEESPPDERFRVGDVITRVNGRPAEDSAAGTELLLIGLRFPETPLEVSGAF